MMRRAVFFVWFCGFLSEFPGVVGSAHGASAEESKSAVVDWKYYVGFWQGIDPVDGAELQRSFVPVLDDSSAESTTLIYSGRNEASQSCGCGPDGCETVVGLVNPVEGMVDTSDGTYTVSVNFTCFGSEEPLFQGVPITLEPLTKNILVEYIAGYPDAIHLHRVGPTYEPL